MHYSMPDKEMLAVVESFKHWKHYLEGSAELAFLLTTTIYRAFESNHVSVADKQGGAITLSLVIL
jgi:hypothetical protein